MLFSQLEEITQSYPQLKQLIVKVKTAITLKAIVLAVLKLSLAIAVIIAGEVLTQRGQSKGEPKVCPKCNKPLESKGLLPRAVKTIIGIVRWKRRVSRCPNGCKIGQIAPLDIELGLQSNQRVSEDLMQRACVLAIFVPFGIAVSLLEILTGVKVSPGAIWNWVQSKGKESMDRLDSELKSLQEGDSPEAEEIEAEVALLPLLIGGDGVMVPFRPNEGTPAGKTVWQEVKVGILTRLGKRMTKKGKEVPVFVRRRLVAVLGTIEEFKSRIWLESLKEGILDARVVVWLSDGGPCYWKLFKEVFSNYAQGILDFYHAAQNIWKGARAWLDGRTKKAYKWFYSARHRLRLGKGKEIMDEIKEGATSEDIPDDRRKIIENLFEYLQKHKDHIDYPTYKALGLPIGSGMVESACKWLIQQRFKCVGMRWSENGFNHLLHLRLAWVNGKYDDLFESNLSSE
jgi:hypothetical protein